MLVPRLGGGGGLLALLWPTFWKGGIGELAKGIEGRVFEVKGEEVDGVNTGTVGLSGPRECLSGGGDGSYE